MANCLLASAITVYCGPLKTLSRNKFFETLLAVCRSHGFPAVDQDTNQVLKLADYSEFMLGVVSRHKINFGASEWSKTYPH